MTELTFEDTVIAKLDALTAKVAALEIQCSRAVEAAGDETKVNSAILTRLEHLDTLEAPR